VLGLTIVAVALADASAIGLKTAFDRERPPSRYPEPDPLVPVPNDASFPSGHAATSFAAATILSFAFPRLVLPLFVLAVAVGFSRIYVGVHYPLDIAGGAAIGAFVAFILRFLVRRRARQLRSTRTNTQAGS
jgi:membrane-associated phospholipid phosphatase